MNYSMCIIPGNRYDHLNFDVHDWR